MNRRVPSQELLSHYDTLRSIDIYFIRSLTISKVSYYRHIAGSGTV